MKRFFLLDEDEPPYDMKGLVFYFIKLIAFALFFVFALDVVLVAFS